MQLGAFSISLAVKDIAASRAFYEKLGFSVFGGDQAQRWLIMKSGSTLVGLFQGMFDKNMLTFNPGWDSEAQALPDFTDVREIQRHLQSLGITPSQTVDPATTTGPGHLTVEDPDGNPILIDQHR
ncbi:MAG: VOC family protein [Ideonella sp.]|nr:VOC family protein [Ideonella sp.]